MPAPEVSLGRIGTHVLKQLLTKRVFDVRWCYCFCWFRFGIDNQLAQAVEPLVPKDWSLQHAKVAHWGCIFCRGNGVLGSIYSLLMELTQNQFKDCRDAPFVMNHSSLLPPTEKVLQERVSEISLYLSSNKMLLGVDLPEIDIIIFN